MHKHQSLLIMAAMLVLAVPCFPAATATREMISPSSSSLTDLQVVTFAWAGANDTGATSATIAAQIRGWYLFMAETIPVANPTASYDIAINNAAGVDLMGGALADRSQTLAQRVWPPTVSQVIDSVLSLAITNQGVAGASGTVKLYFCRTPAPGLITVASLVATGMSLESGGNLDAVTASLAALAVGATPYSFISTASANLTNVKASAGRLYSITAINPGAAEQYIRLYNKATAPDPSACSANTDCPVIYFPVPVTTSPTGGVQTILLGPAGLAFTNGIGYSISGAACTVVSTCVDETNSAAGVTIILGYK
jgi:hypothetical protein